MFQDESVKTILTRSHKAPQAARHPAWLKLKQAPDFSPLLASSDFILSHPFVQLQRFRFLLGTVRRTLDRILFYRFRLNDFKSFNSLFKVLFIFPSQYLFAIGFLHIFSLRRSLSPALCTSIKVHDSSATGQVRSDTTDGAFTLFGSPLVDISASLLVRPTTFRLQFAGLRPEITSVGFSRFRRPY